MPGCGFNPARVAVTSFLEKKKKKNRSQDAFLAILTVEDSQTAPAVKITPKWTYFSLIRTQIHIFNPAGLKTKT